MLKFKHGELNLACIRTMCNIAREAKTQLQMRCLEYVVPLVALVIYLGYMNLWGIPVSLDFGTSFAVKTYLFQ